ncbi:MAG TPA: serine hydroxymethyltransferase, partial [Acidobacteriota bacterium]|nr:serine hydroxymethyltransferase [Acidobacteriota bacterium]
GFQDVTRRGFKPDDIETLCSLILEVIKGKRTPAEVKKDVIKLRQSFPGIKYGFQSVNEAKDYLKKYT